MKARGNARSRRALAAMAVLLGFPLAARAEWVARTVDGIMGTRIQVELWAEQRAAGEAAVDAVMAEMNRIDAAMSTYKPDSELSRLNARAAREPVVIGSELFGLLQTAMEFSRITEGKSPADIEQLADVGRSHKDVVARLPRR